MHFDADTLMNAADMLGTVAFSISGAMTAIQRGLDLFGVFTLGRWVFFIFILTEQGVNCKEN